MSKHRQRWSRCDVFGETVPDPRASDVNKDWTHKDQDKDKDQSHKDKDKD